MLSLSPTRMLSSFLLYIGSCITGFIGRIGYGESDGTHRSYRYQAFRGHCLPSGPAIHFVYCLHYIG